MQAVSLPTFPPVFWAPSSCVRGCPWNRHHLLCEGGGVLQPTPLPNPLLNVTLLRPWVPRASTWSLTPPTLSPSQGWPSCLFLGPSRPFPSPFSFQMSLQPGRAGRMSLTLQLPWSSLLTSFFSLNPKFLKELSPFATFTSCLFTVIYYFIHSFFGQIYILFFNLLFLINLF